MLFRWERANRIEWLCTQNVDRLHHKAGSRLVTELHGTTHRVKCVNCGQITDRQVFQRFIKELNPFWDASAIEIAPDGDVDLSTDLIESFVTPHCKSCGSGIVRPDIVFFGDNVPQPTVDFLNQKVKQSDAVLVLGSSLQVNFIAFCFLFYFLQFEPKLLPSFPSLLSSLCFPPFLPSFPPFASHFTTLLPLFLFYYNLISFFHDSLGPFFRKKP